MKIIFLFFFIMSFNSYASFFDSYGRIHENKTINGKPSSNNGWLYSAVYKKLGGELNIKDKIGFLCAKNKRREPFSLANEIPISRDEILGLVYLGYLKKDDLNGWNFSPKKLEPFNLIKFVKQVNQLVESFFPLKLKHRNFFWKNNLKQIEHIAFSVPIVDRHFLLKIWGEYNLFYHIIHEINILIPRIDRSSRQILFLKTGKDIESVINYYKDNEHPSKILAKKIKIKKSL